MTSRLFEPAKGGRSGVSYVFNEELVLAVNTALAVNRPLLVRGPPGSGKSALGRAVAAELGWTYFEFGFRSQTRVQDLLYRWDETRRLRDAQLAKTPTAHDHEYVEPGLLWWAFDAESATRRGAPPGVEVTPVANPGQYGPTHESAAVLSLDEIDRVDPAACRDLVDVLVAATFHVPELGLHVVPRKRPLVILTSDGERELPTGVNRACVTVALALPSKDQLVVIGRHHLPTVPVEQVEAIAIRVEQLAADRMARGAPMPTTAEFLDVLRILQSLGSEPGVDRMKLVEAVIVGFGGRDVEQALTPVTFGSTSSAIKEPPPASPRDESVTSSLPRYSTSPIFISYRRLGALVHARAVFERLSRELGLGQVFIDLEGIEVGVDFVEQIERQVLGCRVLLALIDPEWVTAADSNGQRRLEQTNDFVRIEIAAALRRGIRVVPILINGAAMPDEAVLPDDLKPLARRHALLLDFIRFDSEIARLVAAIRRILDRPDAAPNQGPNR